MKPISEKLINKLYQVLLDVDYILDYHLKQWETTNEIEDRECLRQHKVLTEIHHCLEQLSRHIAENI